MSEEVKWGEQLPGPQFIDRRKPVLGWHVWSYFLGALAAMSPVIHIILCSKMPSLGFGPEPQVSAYGVGMFFSAIVFAIGCIAGAINSHEIAKSNDAYNDRLEEPTK